MRHGLHHTYFPEELRPHVANNSPRLQSVCGRAGVGMLGCLGLSSLPLPSCSAVDTQVATDVETGTRCCCSSKCGSCFLKLSRISCLGLHWYLGNFTTRLEDCTSICALHWISSLVILTRYFPNSVLRSTYLWKMQAAGTCIKSKEPESGSEAQSLNFKMHPQVSPVNVKVWEPPICSVLGSSSCIPPAPCLFNHRGYLLVIPQRPPLLWNFLLHRITILTFVLPSIFQLD